MTAAVLRSTNCSMAARSSRGMKLTSKGVRGKPYHFSSAPQVTAPAAAVRSDRGRIAVDELLDGGTIVARHEAHIEGSPRKAVPFFECAPGHGTRGGGPI